MHLIVHYYTEKFYMEEVKVNNNIVKWGHIWSTSNHCPTSPEDFKEILKLSNGDCWIYRKNSPLMIFENGQFVKSGPEFNPK